MSLLLKLKAEEADAWNVAQTSEPLSFKNTFSTHLSSFLSASSSTQRTQLKTTWQTAKTKKLKTEQKQRTLAYKNSTGMISGAFTPVPSAGEGRSQHQTVQYWMMEWLDLFEVGLHEWVIDLNAAGSSRRALCLEGHKLTKAKSYTKRISFHVMW